MSRARIVLHLAAIVLPLIAVGGIYWLFEHKLSLEWSLLLPAVMAAQAAASMGWHLLVRYGRSRWKAPLLIGLAMSVVTYLLFGPLVMLAIEKDWSRPPPDLVQGMLAATAMSAMLTGWITAPVVMGLMVWIDRMRRQDVDRTA